MTYGEFQEYYENESERLYKQLVQLSETELIQRVERQEWDSNYQLWQAIAANGSQRSIGPLYNVVKNLDNDYLIRYHACDALFKLANIDDERFKGIVQYGLDENRQAADQALAIVQLGERLAPWMATGRH